MQRTAAKYQDAHEKPPEGEHPAEAPLPSKPAGFPAPVQENVDMSLSTSFAPHVGHSAPSSLRTQRNSKSFPHCLHLNS
jgi:hypothetical protein